jgi:hypothetical protein
MIENTSREVDELSADVERDLPVNLVFESLKIDHAPV